MSHIPFEDRKVLFCKDGKEEVTSLKDLLISLKANGLFRIHEDEYSGIPTGGYLAHFNLEPVDITKGGIYLLPHILEPGFYDARSGEQQLPLLSFDDSYIGEVEELVHNLTYADVTSDMLKYSMQHIQSVEDLKQYMVKRYTLSRPNLTPEDVLKTPISFSLVKLRPALLTKL